MARLPLAPQDEKGLVRWAQSLMVQLNKLLDDLGTNSGTTTSSAVPIGTILPFAGPNLPDGFLECDGALYLKEDYQALYDVIGNFWTSAGQPPETFQVPNFVNRTLRGAEFNPGTYLGQDEVSLMEGNLPAISFALEPQPVVYPNTVEVDAGTGSFAVAPEDAMLVEVTPANVGAPEPIDIRPRSAEVKWMIRSV